MKKVGQVFKRSQQCQKSLLQRSLRELQSIGNDIYWSFLDNNFLEDDDFFSEWIPREIHSLPLFHVVMVPPSPPTIPSPTHPPWLPQDVHQAVHPVEFWLRTCEVSPEGPVVIETAKTEFEFHFLALARPTLHPVTDSLFLAPKHLSTCENQHCV